MSIRFRPKKSWILAGASLASLVAGGVLLESCAGEGGPIVQGGGGGGSISQQFLALLPAGQKGAANVGSNACQKCHNGQGGSEAWFNDWMHTSHGIKGVSCENCHGPASKHVLSPTTANILTYPNSTNPVVCAQCHGPIYNDWAASAHAQLVADPVAGTAGNPVVFGKVLRCIVCHSGLMRGEHTEMGDNPATIDNGEIVNVANQTLNNVPFTASCVTCHNPMKRTGNLASDGSDAQLWHPERNTAITAVAIGTKASSFTNMNQVCAECHNGWGADPSDNALNNNTSRPSFHEGPQYNMLMGFSGVDDGGTGIGSTTHSQMAGQCAKCHMPNARHTFTVSYDTSCTPCHTPNDAANRAATIQANTQAAMLSLLTRMQNWATQKFGHADFWDYTSNITEPNPPDESQVPIEIKRARHNYYFILHDHSYGVHNAPYNNRLLQVAANNLDSLGLPPAPPNSMTRAQIVALLERQLQLSKLRTRQYSP